MKRRIAFIGIIILAGLVASCGKDKNIEQAAPTASTVTLGARLHDGTSRAGSVTIPDGHELRYILEVWSTGGRLLQRQELASATGENVEFSFKLDATGDYKALLWADFVPEGATLARAEVHDPYGHEFTFDHYPDNHYNTLNSLREVRLAHENANYIVNDPTRDAFFGSVEIKKGVGAYDGTVTLARPFGQLNLVEKNTALAATMTSATLAYSVPYRFNVETGATTGTTTVTPTVSTPATGSGILLTDYIFAPAAPGQTTLGEIAITFVSNNPARVLDDFTIPANTPVARNRRTNVSGKILHQSDKPSPDANLSVSVSDTWDSATGDIETDLSLYIPDANFRDFCIQQEYADANGYIIKEKAAAVTELKVNNKGIASLKGIEHFTGLTKLYCDDNQLTDLDVKGNPALTTLFCTDNRLSTLDVTGCAKLTHLNCGHLRAPVKLTTLKVTGCIALTTLYCDGNQLSDLDVTTCTALTTLYCPDNQLDKLDVTRCTALNTLYCDDNQLDNLDVTRCTALNTLYCSNNQLDNLDVKGCTALTTLYCSNNQLTTLDMTGCTALTELYCFENKLATLDASNMGNTADWKLYCGGQKDRFGQDGTLSLTLRADQQTRWDSQLSTLNSNARVNVTYKQ